MALLRGSTIAVLSLWLALLHTCADASVSVALNAPQSYNTCERRDGDCPAPSDQCPGPRLTTTVHLGGNAQLRSTAHAAQQQIEAMRQGHNVSLENLAELHMSINYFCCHNLTEQARMQKLLQDYVWHGFVVNLTQFGCNLDMHNNQTVYLHALGSNSSQTQLLHFVRQVEQYLADHGVTIHHPRQSLFHMTLARVDRTFPTDDVVNALEHTNFGSFKMCSMFVLDGQAKASSCPDS